MLQRTAKAAVILIHTEIHGHKEVNMARKAKLTIHPKFKIGEISPRLFSTFLEPIGTMVNGTMYNPKHPTADENGFRTDFIDALKQTGMPAVRLPGGNYVSCWDWKDSIGPKSERKTHLDLAWHQYITNDVGHDEYLKWAELVNTEAMYTANLGTGDIRDAIALVEYTNHEGGSYWSDLRRKNGHEKPYGVKTWYLGNEMDGPWQIGSWEKDPRGYGVRVNEISKAVKWVDGSIETAVCASSAPFMSHYPQWEEDVLQQCYESVDYISMHHYHVAPPGDYHALLGGSIYYEDYINTEIALCDLIQTKMRSPKKLMLSIDEYGTMARPNGELHPGWGPHSIYASHYVFDPNRKYIRHDPDKMPDREFPGGDMMHLLTTASTLLAFIRHADRVKIACMTGGLGALCSSNHDHVWKSASHYMFAQFIRFAKGMSLQVATDCETFDIPGYAIDDNSQYATREGLNYIDSCAAWDESRGALNIFVINRSDENEYPLEIDLTGFGSAYLIEHLEMYSEDMSVKNTYESPDNLLPKVNKETEIIDGTLTTHVKPLSWNVIRVNVE